jgi:DNA-binding Xre family transcriptional regulator
MSHSDQLFLNSIFLKNRIAELGLKQWWLAEQIGVDRKTVNRWLNGLVRSIQIENIEKLAEALSCKVEDLTLPNELDQMATEDDQRIAAQAVTTSSLIDKLGPIGEWNVIESLLKATIVPNLPLNVLGDLYNQLCVASWRQSKIDQAAIYNKKAKEIALKLNDKALLAHALLSEANIFSWRGFSAQSIESYKDILKLERFISCKTLGAAYSNLGAVLYETGHLSEGQKFIENSIDLFLIDGTPMNLSIAYGHLAMIELQRCNLEASRINANKSTEHAKAFDYYRGIYMEGLILSEIEARIDHHEAAEKLLKNSLEGFESLKINEGLNFEFAGRICRILNQNQRSINFLKNGVAISNDFPLYQAALYRELALTERSMGTGSKDSFSKAIQLFERCQAPLKAIEVENIMNSEA